MFVLFISFIFVLILSVGRTTDNKKVPLKDKLTQSLTHLKDILVNIEGKIEHERKLFSQIKDDLNHKQYPADARIDYDEVTDIWWKSENPVASADAQPGATSRPRPDDTQTSPATSAVIITLPTIFPDPLSSINVPEWTQSNSTEFLNFTETTEPTTTQTPFIQDLKKKMKEYNHNYFTAALIKFMELIATKNESETMPVLNKMMSTAEETINKGTFNNIDEHIVDLLETYLSTLSTLSPSTIKARAAWFFTVLKHKNTAFTSFDRYMFDFYGTRFTEADGEKLFEALESFKDYPNGKKFAAEVSDFVLQAALSPYLREYDTVHKTTESDISISDEEKTTYFLLKQIAVLLREIKYQFENYNQNKHHHLSHKQKFDQNYRRSRDRRGHLNKRVQTKQRAHIPSHEDIDDSKYFQDGVENYMLHKIRETSSYSDEEDYLKNNLYEALIHGNIRVV